jgi:hypothetical protein
VNKTHLTFSGKPVSDEDIAFYILIGLYLAPIWLLRYFPSQDGPIHLANAKYFLDIISTDHSAISNYLAINKSLVANWPSHLVLATGMLAVSPMMAEKMLLSLYVISMPLVARYTLSYANRPYPSAFLIFPLIYNFNFVVGFYNFSLGMALSLLIIGLWIKGHDNFSFQKMVLLTILLLALCLVHMVPLAFCVGTLLLISAFNYANDSYHEMSRQLSACNIRGSIASLLVEIMKILAAASPSLALILLHASRQEPAPYKLAPFSVIAMFPFQLSSFSYIEAIFYTVYIGIILICLYFYFGQTRGKTSLATAFLVLCVASIFFQVIAPDAVMGGGALHPRICLYCYIYAVLAIAGISFTRKTSRFITWFTISLAIVFLVHASLCLYQNAREVETFLDLEQYISNNSTVLTVSRYVPQNVFKDLMHKLCSINSLKRIKHMGHVGGYLALERDAIVLSNYEANTNYFPLTFKTGKNVYKSGIQEYWKVEMKPESIDLSVCKDVHIDYIILQGSDCNADDPMYNLFAHAIDKDGDPISVETAGGACLLQINHRPSPGSYSAGLQANGLDRSSLQLDQ